jgi:hypothetical protein
MTMMATHDSIDDLPVTLPTESARAGVTGHNVRYVLAVSLTGAVIGVALMGILIAYGWFG